MKATNVNIDGIIPYEANPRINDEAVEVVAASLAEFGFRQAIVVDPDGVIIAGHTRLLAAVKLGMEQVPVHVAKDMTVAQIKAYRIADNQTATIAEWDLELLPAELADIRDLGFDMDILGFTDSDMSKMLNAIDNEGLTDGDGVPAPPDDAVTQPGDVWILGDHRLMCGDSGDAGCPSGGS